jgi:hypothetical protein
MTHLHHAQHLTRCENSAPRTALLLALLAMLLGSISAQDKSAVFTRAANNAVANSSHGLGSRWIVSLADRPAVDRVFDLRHQSLSADESANLRQHEIAIRTKQFEAALVRALPVLQRAGANIVQQIDLFHCIVVTMPAQGVRILSESPFIVSVTPDRVCRAQLRVPAVSDDEVIAPEHHAASIAHQIGYTGANRSALLAILDSWLDGDFNGVTRPHRTFYEGGQTSNPSRVLSLNNPLSTSGSLPSPTMPSSWVERIDHGTGMAALAAGGELDIPTVRPFSNGQAPNAGLVGVNITRSWPAWATSYVCNGAQITDGAGCYAIEGDMLAGLQWLALNATAVSAASPIRVACLAFGGPTNPDAVLSMAIDELAANWGILVVTPTGNYDDDPNNPYEAFNTCNGLCVGATDRAPGLGDRHPVASFSGRGPLTPARTTVPCSIGFGFFNNPLTPPGNPPNPQEWQMTSGAYARDYPDIAAIGSAMLVTQLYNDSAPGIESGTSCAGAIAAGALTLLMNGKDAAPQTNPGLSLLEAKATMLATTDNSNVDGVGDNERGAGFLRTDRLTSDVLVDAQTTTSLLSIQNQIGTYVIGSMNVEAGTEYRTAITWFRSNFMPGLVNGAPNWADVDLRIQGLSSSLNVTSAATFGNRTWERTGFVAPVTEVVSIYAVVNRVASASGPIAIGLATTVLEYGVQSGIASISTVTANTPAQCTVQQIAYAATNNGSLPWNVVRPSISPNSNQIVFTPETDAVIGASSNLRLNDYQEVALFLQAPGNSHTPSRVRLRGRFARSMIVPCRLHRGVWNNFGGYWMPDNNNFEDAELVIDADAGIATAEFSGIVNTSFLVFTATPEMAVFMTNPDPAVFSIAPPQIPSGLTHSPWTPLATSFSPGASRFIYDMEWTRRNSSLVSGYPTLTATGLPIAGRSYHLTIGNAEQAPNLLGNIGIILTDFDSTKFPVAIAGQSCDTIYKPPTFWSDLLDLDTGPAASISIDVPLNTAVLGLDYYQQGILVSVFGGSPTPMQLRTTGEFIRVTVGW